MSETEQEKKYTRRLHVRIPVELMKRLEAEGNEKGVSHRQIVESALWERYQLPSHPSREAVIARRLNRIDNRIKVVEREQEIALEYLGLFIRMWLMVNKEVPYSERKAAFESSSHRFCALSERVAQQIDAGKTIISSFPKEGKR